MENSQGQWEDIEKLIEELIRDSRKNLMACGSRIVPRLTEEDLLQPNDYPELENHPHFRYEEGILAGMQTLQMALRAFKRDHEDKVGR